MYMSLKRIAYILLTCLTLLAPVTIAQAEYRDRAEEQAAHEVSRSSPGFLALVTAYTCGPESTGKGPSHPDFCRTASGKVLSKPDEFRHVAADNNYYKFGTKLYIEGLGIVVVSDTGGDIVGPNRLDLFVSQLDANLAYAWGTKKVRVWVLN